ncbi:Ktr system potassium uptake protein B [Metamycoplasma arthritidis]|uniref:TrkH family potassium uptake protein n=1 Tax=Metamycoplasma arthritidis TaxID=2111 RepID=UPI00100511E7|nr:potassium transporter TrkG [Metamycoplasma arthritidis]VEU78826.1 Ktr system potassium uptake protein B [Metamycoplasma arthritidis]
MKSKSQNAKGSNFLFRFFKKIAVVQYIFMIYLIFVVLSSLLLYWPATHTANLKTIKPDFNYSDALFLAASASSDTGLTSLPIGYAFNEFGQAIIAICILVSGFGIFSLKVYIIQGLFGFRLSIFNSKITQVERGADTVGETKKIIKVSITILLITLFISSILFTIFFYTSPHGKFDNALANSTTDENVFNPYELAERNPYHNLTLSLKYGIFHAISSLNNAGFDIIGKKSLNPYYQDYLLQFFTMILFFIGGVGYPVIYDIWCKLKSLKKNARRHRFSLFTKLTLITYACVTLIGFFMTLIFEATAKNSRSFWNQGAYYGTFPKLFAIFFQTTSTRSAGFATVDYYHFTQQTLMLHGLLMFIGFSPASTAGGIRNITIAVIFLSIISTISGRKRIVAFKRQIGKEILIKAITIFAIGTFLIFMGTLLTFSLSDHVTLKNGTNEIDWTKKQFTAVHAFFEISSAFGSSGLSTGLTSHLNIWAKLIFILYMFIGQLGIQQTVLVWGNRNRKAEYYSYIYEDVTLG